MGLIYDEGYIDNSALNDALSSMKNARKQNEMKQKEKTNK